MGIEVAAIGAWVAANATTIGAVAAVAGATVGAVSSIEAGKQQKAADDYNAQVASNNAAYQNEAAIEQAAKIRKVGLADEASANASLAGSGVKLGEGTAVDINRTINQNTESDAFNTLLTGQRAVNSGQQQASLLKTAGSNTTSNSYIGAGATILGSAASVGRGWKASAQSPT